MQINTLILGAGAAGMMAAAHAGHGVLIVDHAKAAGEKIRISGGGRCNFTNMGTSAENFISRNPHFAKSALSRYTQWDFLALVSEYGIAWHEKTLGQLFCDDTAKDIIAMLRAEMDKAGARLWLHTDVGNIQHDGSRFQVTLVRDGEQTVVTTKNLVVATGGKSIPKMGSTGLAYQIASQFGVGIVEPRPGLVPLRFSNDRFKPLAGVSTPIRASVAAIDFDEAMLFTHRGLSGPAILQISSYWQEGEAITVNLTPDIELLDTLKEARRSTGRKALTSILSMHLPARLIEFLREELDLHGNMSDQSDAGLQRLCETLTAWPLRPSGSEGYRTAEVTLGGIDTDDLSSRTMETRSVPGLYFIGEAVDVTGWLGGYNFQWAWSSGWVAGQAIAAESRQGAGQ
ncbi:NAD(P)/FAD-dependent oxidoreductase [Granulosicoccus sp. 3-233]|uniref:NAD(P)/FAD-dependent oxidoreductase n=1 Tax=Granulosicoccus sp. 3-233 TaxID=3417969 RepID=UPI003D3357C7